jgi:tight adherence protein B
MNEIPPIGFLIALFIAVLLFVEGLYFMLRGAVGAGRRQMNRRLAIIAQSHSPQVALRKLQREHGPLDTAVVRIVPMLERMLIEAGSLMPPSIILATMVALAIFVTVLIYTWVAAPIPLCSAIGLAVGIIAPVAYLRIKRAQRLGAFTKQLPDAVDLMMRGLQVGHPVSVAMGLVAKQMTDPIGSEFGIVVDAVSYGRPLNEALRELAKRVPQSDLHYLVAAIEIQHQSGGNLAEVLRNLSTIIRARFYMYGKIHAASAEGRMSAIAIGAMPIVISVILSITKPDYFSAVSSHPLFWPIMSLTPVMLIGGWVMIWRLVNFKV